MKEIKITINGKKYDVKVGDVTTSPIEVVVDGKSYQVEYEAPASACNSSNSSCGHCSGGFCQLPLLSQLPPVAACVDRGSGVTCAYARHNRQGRCQSRR